MSVLILGGGCFAFAGLGNSSGMGGIGNADRLYGRQIWRDFRLMAVVKLSCDPLKQASEVQSIEPVSPNASVQLPLINKLSR